MNGALLVAGGSCLKSPGISDIRARMTDADVYMHGNTRARRRSQEIGAVMNDSRSLKLLQNEDGGGKHKQDITCHRCFHV